MSFYNNEAAFALNLLSALDIFSIDTVTAAQGLDMVVESDHSTIKVVHDLNRVERFLMSEINLREIEGRLFICSYDCEGKQTKTRVIPTSVPAVFLQWRELESLDEFKYRLMKEALASEAGEAKPFKAGITITVDNEIVDLVVKKVKTMAVTLADIVSDVRVIEDLVKAKDEGTTMVKMEKSDENRTFTIDLEAAKAVIEFCSDMIQAQLDMVQLLWKSGIVNRVTSIGDKLKSVFGKRRKELKKLEK